MGLGTIFEMLTSFSQNLGYIGSVDIEWPPSWLGAISYVRALRLDFTDTFQNISIPPLDFRAQHIILTNVIPLSVCIVLLIMFKSPQTVLWYGALLAGFGLSVSGAVLIFAATSSLSSQKSFGGVFIITGGALLLSCQAAFWFEKYMRYRRMRKVWPEPLTGENKDEKIENPTDAVKDTVKSAEMVETDSASLKGDQQTPGNANKEIVSALKGGSTSSQAESAQLKPKRTVAWEVEDNPFVSRESFSVDKMEGSRPDLDNIGRSDEYRPKRFKVQVRNFVIAFMMTFIGMVAAGLLPEPSWLDETFIFWAELKKYIRSLGVVIGLVLFSLGVTLGCNWILGLFHRGRKLLTQANRLFKSYVIMIAMVVLSTLYSPMNYSLLSVFSCKSVTCDAGQEFAFRAVSFDFSSVMDDFTTSSLNKTACWSCYFSKDTCPIVDQLCPSVSDMRLMADNSLSCTTEIWLYYLPGAILMLMAATFGIPYLIHMLISVAGRYVTEIPVEGPTRKMRWGIQAYLSQNSCRALYYMFDFRWRYFNIVLTVQKLFISIVFVFGAYEPVGMVLSLSVVHLLFAGLAIGAQPYSSKHEDYIYITLTLTNTLNAAVAAFVAFNVTIWKDLVVCLVVLNATVPTVALVYALARVYLQDRYFKKIKLRKKEGYLAKVKNEFSAKAAFLSQKAAENFDPDVPQEMSDRKEIEEFVAELDQQLNAVLLRYIVNFLLLMGMAAFLAICCSVIGIVRSLSRDDLLGFKISSESQTETGVQNFEFAGRSNWTAFTSDCCCQMRPLTGSGSINSDNAIVEMWKCLPSDYSKGTPLYKQRIRKYSTNSADGRLIRPYCSTEFNSTYICGEPSYSSDTKTFSVTACPNQVIDPVILKELW